PTRTPPLAEPNTEATIESDRDFGLWTLKMPELTPIYGLIAEFDTPGGAMHAAEKVRDAGYRHWDVYTPFPVHGMDKAMGLKNSKVGWFSFLGGVTGYASG